MNERVYAHGSGTSSPWCLNRTCHGWHLLDNADGTGSTLLANQRLRLNHLPETFLFASTPNLCSSLP